MSELAEKIKTEILLLPASERAEIASFALESLADADQEAIDAAWKVELDRRWAEIQNGTAPGVPAAEALARIRARLT